MHSRSAGAVAPSPFNSFRDIAEELGELSPGTVLLWLVMEDVFRKEFTVSLISPKAAIEGYTQSKGWM